MSHAERWRVETTASFDRDFRKLDRAMQKRVLAYLLDVAELDDPRQRGKGLTGNHTGQWRYRVGDYRIVCDLVDSQLVVLVIDIDHRSSIYED